MDNLEFSQRIQDQPFSILSDLVYQYIVDAIVEFKFPPGAKINTKRVSEELGISRTPVRTALDRLVEERLVEQVGEKGFRVCQVDWQDCMALYDARKMIEGSAAYIAANTITDAQLGQLKQTILDLRSAIKNADASGVFEADNRFHEIIVRSTGNGYLIGMYHALKIWICRYQHSLAAAQGDQVGRDRQIMEKHLVIYRAIKSRYSLVAKTEMEDHLHHIYHELLGKGLVARPLSGIEDR